jgi:multiple antibiotic resistance protein
MLVTLLLVLDLALMSLLLAERIMHWLGETGANVITRLLGLILAALAVQYILDGIGNAFV